MNANRLSGVDTHAAESVFRLGGCSFCKRNRGTDRPPREKDRANI